MSKWMTMSTCCPRHLIGLSMNPPRQFQILPRHNPHLKHYGTLSILSDPLLLVVHHQRSRPPLPSSPGNPVALLHTLPPKVHRGPETLSTQQRNGRNLLIPKHDLAPMMPEGLRVDGLSGHGKSTSSSRIDTTVCNINDSYGGILMLWLLRRARVEGGHLLDPRWTKTSSPTRMKKTLKRPAGFPGSHLLGKRRVRLSREIPTILVGQCPLRDPTLPHRHLHNGSSTG